MYLGCIHVYRVLMHRRARLGVLNSRFKTRDIFAPPGSLLVAAQPPHPQHQGTS
jgi:hypothetical protein